MAKTNLYEIIDSLSLTYHLENTPLGIIVLDNQLCINYWSPRAEQIFEWKMSEVMTRSISSLMLVHEEDAENVNLLLEKIKSGNENRLNSLNRNRTKSGKVVFCEWYNSALKDKDGNVISILSLVLDITAKKIAEDKLHNSEQQLSLIYNSSIDPIWLIDVEGKDQFRFRDINNSFTTVTGLPKEKVIGFLIEEVLPEDVHQLVKTKYNEAILTGKVIDFIATTDHPAGKKYQEIRVIPVKDSHGIITKLVGISNDITERTLLQFKLDKERDAFNRKITAAAIKGQELERTTVGRELHDNVNQVLTTIKLYIELCEAGSVDATTILPKCARLLNETITEIRDLSKRLSAPSLGDIGFMDTLSELVETIKATKVIDVSLDTAAVNCTVMDNELHLAIYRIAQEHLTNVLKHAKANKVGITLEANTSQFSMRIHDNGKGFDPKQKTVGLGITNMESRAKIFDGDLQIDSALGKGCTLEVSFPIKIINGKCYPTSKAVSNKN